MTEVLSDAWLDKVRLSLTNQFAGGLTDADYKLAARLDGLASGFRVPRPEPQKGSNRLLPLRPVGLDERRRLIAK